jgi:hypothetical protein
MLHHHQKTHLLTSAPAETRCSQNRQHVTSSQTLSRHYRRSQKQQGARRMPLDLRAAAAVHLALLP